MQFKLISLLAAFLGTAQVLAVSHGDMGTHDGSAIRWQQLAEGVFTGVPADKWDDKVHKKGTQEWDVDEIKASSHNGTHGSRDLDLELEARNLASQCQAVYNCVKYGAQWTLLTGINTWTTVANYAAEDAGTDLWEFLKSPFFANAGGVAIAGVISGQINAATETECSTSGSELDALNSALAAVLAANPSAGSVTVQINGPSGSWTLTANAGAVDSTPTATC